MYYRTSERRGISGAAAHRLKGPTRSRIACIVEQMLFLGCSLAIAEQRSQ